MKRSITLLLAVACIGLCSAARSDDLPNRDFRTECEGRKLGHYETAVCLAKEQNAERDLRAKWGALPTEIQQHCSSKDNQTYGFIATCVLTELISVKAKKGLCPDGSCTKPDPELDPLFPVSHWEDPDVAPFPSWDIGTGCGASLKKFGMDADVGICVSHESLAKVRLALYWNRLEGVFRYECLERTAPMQSYDLLGACTRTKVINAN